MLLLLQSIKSWVLLTSKAPCIALKAFNSSPILLLSLGSGKSSVSADDVLFSSCVYNHESLGSLVVSVALPIRVLSVACRTFLGPPSWQYAESLVGIALAEGRPRRVALVGFRLLCSLVRRLKVDRCVGSGCLGLYKEAARVSGCRLGLI